MPVADDAVQLGLDAIRREWVTKDFVTAIRFFQRGLEGELKPAEDIVSSVSPAVLSDDSELLSWLGFDLNAETDEDFPDQVDPNGRQ